MGKVNFLSEEVISKIAAGEVVERPASALKELVENSIDAKSKSIEVEVKNGGKKLLSVKDNGEGIEPDDMEKIFMRHATSKIKSIEDLNKIISLGFRGEALYSIGAVSDVILKSRVEEKDEGKEIHIRGGEKISVKTVNMKRGTFVEVRELFFNTPARKKFLKSDQTEFRHILNIFIPYTIVWNDIKFSLTHNEKEIIKVFPDEELISRFSKVLNIDEKNLIYEEAEILDFDIKLKLILGNLNLKRPSRNLQFIFVNKRPVYNYSISSSLNDVYRTVLPNGVFPVFCVMLEVPPEMVDVNIHPTKREVKIRDEKKLSLKIGETVARLIVEKGKPSKVEGIKKEVVFYTPEIEKKIEIKEKEEKSIFEELKEGKEREKQEDYRKKLKEGVYVGIFRKKYLLFEYSSSLFVIDQHAAHERINYEKFLNQIRKKNIQIQRLLTPVIINLTPVELSVWEEGKEIIEKIGFLTTRWDKESIAIYGYPSFIKNSEIAMRNILSDREIRKWDEEKLARNACRASVMAGEDITEKEAIAIKNSLLECENPLICPHGRPTVIEISEDFFDREFLR